MIESLSAYLEACFSGPVLPASALLGLVGLYWVLMILGAFDFDLVDFDVDLDTEPHSFLGFGLAPLRFLNIGQVPFMLWLSVFALSWWTVSMVLDRGSTVEDGFVLAQAVARNVGLGLVATKILTQPLRGRFDSVEPNPVEGLVGGQCVITTSEATPEFGEARFETGAAPLILSVRTGEGTLPRGRLAEIIDFDPEKNVYLVRGATNQGVEDV